ncbi:MAG: hydrogenase 3 maturation endopeptidase HyCI [bacterium]
MSRSPVVIVGVGNTLRGDDAVGPIVIERLGEVAGAQLFDAGPAPENFLDPVTELAPDRILFVDACDFRAAPGEFRVFEMPDIERLSAGLVSTHTLPLTMTAQLFTAGGARVSLLGIQPRSLEFGAPLSGPVVQALPAVLAAVRAWVAGPAT